jgi:hypothetical protein
MAQTVAIPDFSANYQVHLNGIQAGELKRSLASQADGNRLFKSETQAKGVFAFFKPEKIVESSLWHWNQGKVEPQAYVYSRKGGKKNKEVHLDFDWPNNRVHINDGKQPWSLKLRPQTLDKLIYQIALMSDLAEGKQEFRYKIADGGKIKIYDITILGEEVVTTPLGQFSAVKLLRKREQKNERITTLWCAPSLNYLPVKLEHTEKDGSVFTATIRTLKGIETKGRLDPVETADSSAL